MSIDLRQPVLVLYKKRYKETITGDYFYDVYECKQTKNGVFEKYVHPRTFLCGTCTSFNWLKTLAFPPLMTNNTILFNTYFNLQSQKKETNCNKKSTFFVCFFCRVCFSGTKKE